MDLVRTLRFAALWVVLLLALGTLGYASIEGMTAIDALYMTVITVSTVGYREVVPLSRAGQLFTMGLIVTGVGSFFYFLVTFAGLVVEGRLREVLGRGAMQRRVDQLSGHVIVCGYGRFGRAVVEELQRAAVPLVIIDSDAALEEELRKSERPYLIGSALADDVLDLAGVGRARAIVVVTPSDADNVFITLSAREKNSSLRIHARGSSDAALRRLQLAGANQAISAYHLGGIRIAASILRPAVVDFLEISAPGHGDEMDLEQIQVLRDSSIIGRSIAALEEQSPRLRIVALKRGDEPLRIIPEGGIRVEQGDHLVVIGERGSLESLAQLAAAGGA